MTPLEWSNFVEDPNNIIIDVRNDYENKVGTFKNSISPNTKNFREFKDFVKKINLNLKGKILAFFVRVGLDVKKHFTLLK